MKLSLKKLLTRLTRLDVYENRKLMGWFSISCTKPFPCSFFPWFDPSEGFRGLWFVHTAREGLRWKKRQYYDPDLVWSSGRHKWESSLWSSFCSPSCFPGWFSVNRAQKRITQCLFIQKISKIKEEGAVSWMSFPILPSKFSSCV